MKYYIVVKQPPMYHQMTLEEFLFGSGETWVINPNVSNTKTYERDVVPEKMLDMVNVNHLIDKLHEFNGYTEDLRGQKQEDLFRTFYIPKSSGGFRRIDAPQPMLMNALRCLKAIFEEDFGALYHTSAFAYIKNRSTIDAVKRHQKNESKWFLKLDLHDFFGSTTPEFVMKMFGMVFPFSEVLKREEGKAEFEKAISLAFLNGGLPQGTPISPIITNIMMIPIDFALSKTFRDFNKTRHIYTRYADDFLISSRYNFRFRDAENEVKRVLSEFGAPFELNSKKTRYGSSNGSNWNLGVMLNSQNQITVGSKKKRRFEAALSSFVMDTKNGEVWPLEDVQRLEGLRSYYKMVEGETIDKIVAHIGKKYGVNVVALIKECINGTYSRPQQVHIAPAGFEVFNDFDAYDDEGSDEIPF